MTERVLGLLDTAHEADGKERGVMVHEAKVAKGREVGLAGWRACGKESDGPGDDGADEELVVGIGGAAGLVRIDGDVLAATVSLVCAPTKLPRGVNRLCKVEFLLAVKVFARCLDALEIRVGIVVVHGLRHGGLWTESAVSGCDGEWVDEETGEEVCRTR